MLYAARYGRDDVVRLLLSLGTVHIDVPHNDGTTALDRAVQQCHVKCIQMLLLAGAVPHPVAVRSWRKVAMASTARTWLRACDLENALCLSLRVARHVRLLPITNDYLAAFIAQQLFELEHPLLQEEGSQEFVRACNLRADNIPWWLQEAQFYPLVKYVREEGVVVGQTRDEFLDMCRTQFRIAPIE